MLQQQDPGHRLISARSIKSAIEAKISSVAELAVFSLENIALELSSLSFDSVWWLLAMKSIWPNLPLVEMDCLIRSQAKSPQVAGIDSAIRRHKRPISFLVIHVMLGPFSVDA